MPPADPAPATTGTAAAPSRRVPLWDNARFLCVTLVVIGHGIQRLTAQSDTALIVYLVIYSFHMPAFAIISGYFSQSGAPSARAMRRVLTDILLPYLIMETIWTLVQFLVEGKQEFNPTRPSWTLWFLLALGIFRLVLPYLALLRWPLLISVVLAVGVSYYDNIDSTFSLARAIGIMPFFIFGWRLRGVTPGGRSVFARWLAQPPARVLGVRIVAVLFFAVAVVVMSVNIDAFRAADLRFWFFYDRPYDALGETQWWAGLVRLALMAAAAVLSLALFALVPRRRTPFTARGRSTMYVYLLHSFVLYPLRESGVLSRTDSTLALVLMILFCIGVSIALSLGWTRTVFHRLVEPRAAWLFAPDADARPDRAGPTGAERDRQPERR
ncbi:acyltransferase family protein [Rathayibacter tritici]|uniref:acyltransferase family protein n=1 Tax=Rathayibacter tritici TaxID=33888 RepID=UPI00201346FD|nr:acyltransferase family protein [Rathayibacter tritici]